MKNDHDTLARVHLCRELSQLSSDEVERENGRRRNERI